MGLGEKSLNSCLCCRSSSAVDQGPSLPSSINKGEATVGDTNPGKSTWDCTYAELTSNRGIMTFEDSK